MNLWAEPRSNSGLLSNSVVFDAGIQALQTSSDCFKRSFGEHSLCETKVLSNPQFRGIDINIGAAPGGLVFRSL
jgi:hypothetical protein